MPRGKLEGIDVADNGSRILGCVKVVTQAGNAFVHRYHTTWMPCHARCTHCQYGSRPQPRGGLRGEICMHRRMGHRDVGACMIRRSLPLARRSSALESQAQRRFEESKGVAARTALGRPGLEDVCRAKTPMQEQFIRPSRQRVQHRDWHAAGGAGWGVQYGRPPRRLGSRERRPDTHAERCTWIGAVLGCQCVHTPCGKGGSARGYCTDRHGSPAR